MNQIQSLPYARVHADGVTLAIRAQPRANRNEIVGVVGEQLKIRIAASPVDSAANEALVGLLAKVFGLPKSAIQILTGHQSRQKVVLLKGLELSALTVRSWRGISGEIGTRIPAVAPGFCRYLQLKIPDSAS